MKATRLALLVLFLMLGVAAAQQSNAVSNSKSSGMLAELKAKAEKGDALAQFQVCAIFATGDGVTENKAEAIKWCRKSAEQGYAPAEYNLGLAYNTGDGVGINKTEAAKWFQKAALQGASQAELQIGFCYTLGDGVPKDYVEAYKWFNLASSQGNEGGKKALSIIEPSMTVEQIAEGQRLATAFVPKRENSRSQNTPENLQATGTGFFITDDGYLISNNHVVKGATKVRIVTSAGTFDGKVVQTDTANDLALLKIEGHFTTLPVAPSRKVSLGNTVATVGFPDPGLQGFSPKLAKGEIASLSGAEDDARYFQISVPVQPGNSGGALVDEHGNVVGIVSAKLNAAAALASSGSLPENVNYAIKSSYLLSFLESVPGVESKLKPPVTADRKFEDVVKSAQDATVLVLVY